MPLERLALSPQCGFASTMEGNRITPAEQQAKLRRVVETANADLEREELPMENAEPCSLWPCSACRRPPRWAQSIKMGAVVPLTGRYGAGGAQIRAGYEFAVERLNAGGGIPVGGVKMPVELVLLDDESDATKTVARMETLAAQGVIGYLGGFGSDLHAAAASVAEKNRIPYLGVAFALQKIHQQGFRYLFSPFWKSPDIGHATQGLLELIPAGERPRTVAIFQEKTDWGREMAAAWTEAGKTKGYQVVVNGEYAPGAKDFSDLILKAKAANADVLAWRCPTRPTA